MQKLKFVLIGLTLMLFLNTVHANEMEKLNSGIGILADKIIKQMQSHNVKLIAMGDFDNSNGKTLFERNIEIGLVNSIVTKNLSDISVIERKNLSEVLKEQKLSSTGLLAKKTRAKLGEILGVEAIVTAETTVLKREVTVNVRMYSINTGRILAAPSYTFPRNETIDELLSQPAKERSSYSGVANKFNHGFADKPFKQDKSTCFSNKFIRGCSKISRSSDKKRVSITATLINHSDTDLYLAQNTDYNWKILCTLIGKGRAYTAVFARGLAVYKKYDIDRNKISISNLTALYAKSKIYVTYSFTSDDEIEGNYFDFSANAVMYYSEDKKKKNYTKHKLTISGSNLYIPPEKE